jgi:hypothetical protein
MTPTKQVNVKLDADSNRWLEEIAGGTRERAEFIRELIERERTREAQARALEMFNTAAAALDAEDRAAREELLDGFSGTGP